LSKRNQNLHHSPLQGLGDAVPFDLARGGPNAKGSELEFRLLSQVDAVHPRDVLR
jgi:hypothetical protein